MPFAEGVFTVPTATVPMVILVGLPYLFSTIDAELPSLTPARVISTANDAALVPRISAAHIRVAAALFENRINKQCSFDRNCN
jgi:hypothetical protein